MKLRMNYPGFGYDSGDRYGKVIGDIEGDGGRLTRSGPTSMDEADQKTLETFLEG